MLGLLLVFILNFLNFIYESLPVGTLWLRTGIYGQRILIYLSYSLSKYILILSCIIFSICPSNYSNINCSIGLRTITLWFVFYTWDLETRCLSHFSINWLVSILKQDVISENISGVFRCPAWMRAGTYSAFYISFNF